MPEHHLVVSRYTEGLERLAKIREVTEQDIKDYGGWGIECSDLANCSGWIECDKDGHLDPDETDEYEGVMMHGEPHDLHCYMWTVEYPGCPVQGFCEEPPDGLDTSRDGRYLIDVDWDDEDCTLTIIKEVTNDD